MTVGVSALADAPDSLDGYDAVVIGDPIRIGKHSKDLAGYVARHLNELAGVPSAFFSVSLAIASPNEDEHEEVHKIAQAFLEQCGWKPDLVAFFGGRLAYTKYGFITKRMMRHIASKEGGVTDMSHDVEMTDWDAVAEFADHIAMGLRPVD